VAAGKAKFLIGVKNPVRIGRLRPLENTALAGAVPVARFATLVGLRPPFLTHPATLSLPVCRTATIDATKSLLKNMFELLSQVYPVGNVPNRRSGVASDSVMRLFHW
jgi:hypothetical protein